MAKQPVPTVDWQYSLEVVIPLGDGGRIDLYRHGIKSETDAVFMAGVIAQRVNNGLEINVTAIKKASHPARWEKKWGVYAGGQIMWQGGLS